MRTDNAKNYSKLKTIEDRILLRKERITKLETELTDLEKKRLAYLKLLGI